MDLRWAGIWKTSNLGSYAGGLLVFPFIFLFHVGERRVEFEGREVVDGIPVYRHFLLGAHDMWSRSSLVLDLEIPGKVFPG